MIMMRAKAVLLVAASSSDGCAGLGLDTVVASGFGFVPACAVTAVTSQNSKGVKSVFPVPAAEVRKQIDAVFSDMDGAAVKVGMLWGKETALAVAKALGEWGALNVVFDPVMSAQSDRSAMAKKDAVDAFRAVAAVSDLVTPNLDEAKALSGIAVRNEETACRAAWKVMEAGAQAVLLKSYPWGKGVLADIVITDEGLAVFKKERLGTSTHGGGCLLSTAIACGLGNGMELLDAVSAAEEYVGKAIAGGIEIGSGIRAVNPRA